MKPDNPKSGQSLLEGNGSQTPCTISDNVDDLCSELVLWRRPFQTMYYFAQDVVTMVKSLWTKIYKHRRILLTVVSVFILICLSSFVKGPHQPLLQYLHGRLNWSLYWMGLGVLSSIGLGSGLHTFILYLGPHIASVTLAGYECGGLNFPEPPYPQQIVCPSQIDPRWVVSVWNIMWKVRLESIMWGAGTALGELPPYFMARAARQSGINEDEDLKELEELQKTKDKSGSLSTVNHMKLIIHMLIQRVGFFGILVCASIPNPLFDLAGISCGHFGVTFWTFFGATLLGKSVIKMSLQTFFVIIAFSDVLLEKILDTLSYIPVSGEKIQEMFSEVLEKQKRKLNNPTDVSNETTIIETVYDFFIFSMVMYCVITFVNYSAQNSYKKSNNGVQLKSEKCVQD